MTGSSIPLQYRTALIVGAGTGLGASLARTFQREGGMRVVVSSRQPERLETLAAELGTQALACDVGDAAVVAKLFEMARDQLGDTPEVVVFNPSARVRGPVASLDPAAVAQAVNTTALGGFYVAQRAAQGMLGQGRGAILFTGASASVKGYAQSAPFAMGKFAVRGLAQSMARELAPKGIHVGHIVIDGAIRSLANPGDPDAPDALLDADAIAASYLHLLNQHRSAWSWEIELRPWVERF